MIWTFYFIGASIALIALSLFFFREDWRFMRKRTRDVLSPVVKEEIEVEIEAAKKRHKKFETALNEASRKTKSPDNTLT